MGPGRANGEDEVDPFSLQLYNTLWKEGMRADGADLASASRIWLHVDDQGVASEVEVWNWSGTVLSVVARSGPRAWCDTDICDAMDAAFLSQVDKHVLVYELGVRYRDLLTLDPSLPLPFPAAILIRERALVVNLESVRMIICANQCYILSVPSVSRNALVSHLCAGTVICSGDMPHPDMHAYCSCAHVAGWGPIQSRSTNGRQPVCPKTL